MATQRISTGFSTRVYSERMLIGEYHAVVPGDAFGPSGAGHVRMCYAMSYQGLEEALRRIGCFAARVQGATAQDP